MLAITSALVAGPAIAENCRDGMARMTSAQTMRLARCSFNLETQTPVNEEQLTDCRQRVVGHGLAKYKLKCLNFNELVEITYAHTDAWIVDALAILQQHDDDPRCQRRLGRAVLIAWKTDIRFGPPWENRSTRRIERLADVAQRVCGDDLSFWLLMATIGDHRLDPDTLPAVER